MLSYFLRYILQDAILLLRYILQDAILLFKVYSTRCYLTFLVNELETQKITSQCFPVFWTFPAVLMVGVLDD